MQTLTRTLIGLVGAINMVVGFGFLLAPGRLAKAFFITPVGIEGMATLRADFPGFFIGAAVFALLGAVRNRADLLLVPLVLLSIVLAGRCLSLVLDGSTSNSLPVMGVEAAMIALLYVGHRTLDRQA